MLKSIELPFQVLIDNSFACGLEGAHRVMKLTTVRNIKGCSSKDSRCSQIRTVFEAKAIYWGSSTRPVQT